MSLVRKLTSVGLATVASLGFSTGAVTADDVESFYRGKTVKIIVGSGPGGGYDTYARLVGRHLGKHVPGSPSFIVQNKQGAASIIATNFIMNVAPKDGSIIGGIQREIALVQLSGRKGPKYKATDIQWLGSLAKEAGVCAVATRTGIKSFEDAYKTAYAMGGLGQNASEFWPALFNNLIATKFRLIRGYPGSPQIHLAIERGELDGVCQSWASFKELSGNFLKEGKIKPLVQVALQPDPEMQKLGVPMLADLLTADNLAKGQKVEDVRTFFKLTMVPGIMGRPFMMANGVPKARLAAMRSGFTSMVKDPAFLKDAKRLKREIELVTGEEIQKLVEEIAEVPQAKLAALDGHFKFKGKVEKVVLPIIKHAGKVVATKRGGRRITIDYNGKKRRANVSGSKTKVMVDGKKVKRKAIKVGMNCIFHYYGHKTTAKQIICTN
jgi:tripartite-type tricarboxylate transporter receptor subunit TctC